MNMTQCRGNPLIKPGSYSLTASTGKMRGKHVLAYEEAHGPLAKGMVIDHLCRNRYCYEVTHLEAVTHKENCRRGKNVTLTMREAEYIRAQPKYYGSAKELATRFGVSSQTISDILAGRTWV